MIAVNQQTVSLLERAGRTLLKATNDLSTDEFFYRETVDTNHLGFMMFRPSRFVDDALSRITGESQLFESGGYAKRFGLPLEHTGMDYTSAQVGALNDPEALTLYCQLVFYMAMERIPKLTQEDLDRMITPDHGAERPASALLENCINISLQYAGQAAYLRGVINAKLPTTR